MGGRGSFRITYSNKKHWLSMLYVNIYLEKSTGKYYTCKGILLINKFYVYYIHNGNELLLNMV